MSDLVMTQSDASSTFSYDGEADPDSFSLVQLQAAVTSHFCTPCRLEKLAEGGYHKVYDVLGEDGSSLGVVRVAAPAFPKDKLESEVAILKHLAAHTRIPVPAVYAWNSDASNPVGAEYAILQKLPGVSADKPWPSLSTTIKTRIVSQIAAYVKELFGLRFERAGSPYLAPASQDAIGVGPIVSVPFYRALDGIVRGGDPSLSTELSCFRGPFRDGTDYLQSFLRPELYIISHHPSILLAELADGEDGEGGGDPSSLEAAQRILEKALGLCAVYPGNEPGGRISTPLKPFSILLDDFRLSNVMIDIETGTVTGLIDFEGVTIAPLWECAVAPSWLLDPDDSEGSYEGGPKEERLGLYDTFCKTMDSEEWRELNEYGKPFRHFRQRLSLQASTWISAGVEEWVDKRLAWTKSHPGVALPEEIN